MVAPILPVDIVDDFLTAFVAEIHVEIRHTDAFRVQKPLEDQVVPDGVNVRNADAVSRDAARTGATTRADRDALTFGVVDVIKDNEVIVGIAHGLDHADLILQAVFVGLRHVRPIAAFQTLPTEFLKVCLIVHPVRCLVIRDLGVTKLEVKLTLVCDLLGVLTGFRYHREEIVHLVGGLDVELVGLELHPVGVLNGLAGLDAQQDALHLGILFPQVVGVVGSRHGDARLPRQFDELRQNDVVFLEAVILQLKVIVALAEEILIPERSRFCPLVIPGKDGLRDLTGKAG